MKKITLSLLCLLCSLATMAEGNTKDKEKKNYLPEAGEIAIGTDLVPLFKAIGNIFYQPTGEQGFGGSPVIPNSSVTVMGKYMVTDNFAARVNLGIFLNSNNVKTLVPYLAAQYLDPLSVATVENARLSKETGFSLSVGGEYRIGKRRVQGVFGLDLIAGSYSTSHENIYGNACTNLNSARRDLFVKNENAFLIGAQLSAGIEYFVAPKIAIGGQVNLSYVGSIGGQQYRKSEYFDMNTEKKVEWTDIIKNGDIQHEFSTNNIGAALYMMFYF